MHASCCSHALAALSLLLLSGCPALPDGEPAPHTLTVLYTNDEHGWMRGMEQGRGAAELMALWREQEGYRDDGSFLLLSGGDNWTGPAISTWTEGESMVEVMNAMGYDASAVGNHEFDFGLETMTQRLGEADFPYLSANTLWRDTGEVATELGLLPYSVLDAAGMRIGVIGLTTRATAVATNPKYVSALRFEDYERALRRTAPAVRARGVDLLFVISHVCVGELNPLIRRVQDLDIDLVGAGHCNELVATRIGGTVLLGGGYHFTAYAVARFTVSPEAGTPPEVSYRVNENTGAGADPAVATLIAEWSSRVAGELDEVIAYSARPETRGDGRLNEAIVDAWLWHDPSADIAINNAGGVRMDLPAGEITLGTLVAMLPFDNTIVAVQLSGAAVAGVLEEGSRPVVAGLARAGDGWIVERTGEPLSPDATYRVLVNSFMYAGGSGYGALAREDPDAFDTGIHYRQPFQDWLEHLASDRRNPLRL